MTFFYIAQVRIFLQRNLKMTKFIHMLKCTFLSKHSKRVILTSAGLQQARLLVADQLAKSQTSINCQMLTISTVVWVGIINLTTDFLHAT